MQEIDAMFVVQVVRVRALLIGVLSCFYEKSSKGYVVPTIETDMLNNWSRARPVFDGNSNEF
jgi:hypothetical protein